MKDKQKPEYSIMVKGKDKRGNYWYVESNEPVDVNVCKQCGNPVYITNKHPTQAVQKIRVTKPLVVITEVTLDEIKEYVKNNKICTWCGAIYKEEA
ncbi:MAG: hypothetical protein PHE15_02840 [Dehalococcoidales bacterium]|nr:hypothetical protein [Dehalococcoidales bacterium]